MNGQDAAREVFDALAHGRQIAPFSTRDDALTIASAYAVTARLRCLRQAAGDIPAGRKIGFTNRTIWDEYGVHAPIWGDMYRSTIHETDAHAKGTLPLAGLCEPRIEPEIVFGLNGNIEARMDDGVLLSRIDWIAHGFEVVQSIFPGWEFQIADTIACGGLHGRIIIGPRRPMTDLDPASLVAALGSFRIELLRNGVTIDSGGGANVLDSPLNALRHLAGALDGDRDNPPLQPGEIVTTGTLTRAFPVSAGETWTTRLAGLELPGLDVAFV